MDAPVLAFGRPHHGGPSGSFERSPRRYAVALGCEAAHAAEFVYADGLDLATPRRVEKIGVSCRLCPRPDCDQRAFPPADRAEHLKWVQHWLNHNTLALNLEEAIAATGVRRWHTKRERTQLLNFVRNRLLNGR